ncbi:Acg family FMN-binding oxidoreductase [Actinoplanes sp. NPDC049265]|uniref:Acg family FMN-binding oxidoreductase n=1 Tax=Actinoplanes sp. NPDC049265 TaxID=3363902 RepID=UPI00372323E1
MLISVGAALFTLRLAIRAAGRRPEVRMFPDPRDRDFVTTFELGPEEVPTPPVEALAAAVAHRHTNRWPFARSAVPEDAFEHLRDAARREGARFEGASSVSRNAIIGLSEVADSRLRARGGYRAKLARWTLPGRRRVDGVPSSAVGPWDALESLPIRDFGLLQPQMRRASETFEPHPTIAVLSTVDDAPADWVTAGQALQRVLLTATWLNLATTPISQPVEIPVIRRLLTDQDAGRWAQIVLRLGYGRPAATPRRPVADVLLAGPRVPGFVVSSGQAAGSWTTATGAAALVGHPAHHHEVVARLIVGADHVGHPR